MSDNTKIEFYGHWTKEQLMTECARLNKVMDECAEISRKALETTMDECAEISLKALETTVDLKEEVK